MNAIVPINIQAIRVSANDSSNVVSQFQGLTAGFDNMPYTLGQNEASTGDKIYVPLTTPPTNSPANPLGIGVHIHWELPAYFKKGHQSSEKEKLIFPHVPNRWVVIRYLSIYDSGTSQYGPISCKCWVVESDYLAPTLSADQYGITRPAISVPINNGSQPYMYMGRVVDYEKWAPGSESPSNYLPSYNGADGSPLYLTSIGFVGPHFSSYYPECCSVFGFWDTFAGKDDKEVFDAINNNKPVQFRASYQVIGWINDASKDPLTNIVQTVTNQYNSYLSACNKKSVNPELTPADFFNQIMKREMKWDYNAADISYTLNSDNSIKTLNLPTQTVCSGILQEVVWNMETNPATTYFLASSVTPEPNAVWPATAKLAIGNTVQEALSAILKAEMGQTTIDKNVLTDYEYLLDALQLGLLNDLENTPDILITLEEELHKNGFSRHDGGKLWEIVSSENSQSPSEASNEVTLPKEIASALHSLNVTQKAYDVNRAQLMIKRKQLFMDWIRYVKIYTGETSDPNVAINDLSNFLYTTSSGELNNVQNQQQTTGLLQYSTDPTSGVITGISVTPPSSTLAYNVWGAYNILGTILKEFNTKNPKGLLQIQGVSDSHFYMPTDPVLIMESDKVTLSQRQGKNKNVFVRLSPELLTQLNISYESTSFSILISDLNKIPVINNLTPMQTDIQALVGEAWLMLPMMANVLAAALAVKGGANNPALANLQSFTISLMYAQGGLSPLDIAPNTGGIPAPSSNGLFETITQDGYTPGANSVIQISSPQTITFTYTNAANNGWVTDAVGWSKQSSSQLGTNRVDPFLPLFMIWNIQLNPLTCKTKDSNGNPAYSLDNITSFFTLDTDAVDYKYLMPAGFTSPVTVNYSNSALISSNSAGVLVHQLNKYLTTHPHDPDYQKLQDIVTEISGRQFFSQALGSFNAGQVLTNYIAQVDVEDLTFGSRDSITTAIQNAAIADDNDTWYTHGFNSIEPIATGSLAQNNFGPLRSGFLEVGGVEVVDIFGQRMQLSTSSKLTDNNLNCNPSYALGPDQADTMNAQRVFLPPRLLTPTRLWFRWISGKNFRDTKGDIVNFEEMNPHPDTSPVCGWIMPNHLDNSLFFYDANGTAIGSFGVETQSGIPTLAYRTKAGNANNPDNNLAVDIGSQNQPTVNASLADFMWYVDGQTAQFLSDLMASIQNSSQFLNPANFAESVSLSVLIGNALALTRVVLAIETQGNLLPLSQADNNANSPFPYAVANNQYEYTQRMQSGSANLGAVQFPVRLGDLANMNDGLVGYLIEKNQQNPYTGATLYSPAATAQMNSGVEQPQADTIQLTLNATPLKLTLLMDPRAGIHATTGVLPVSELHIPKDQYVKAMKSLAVSFVNRPVLQMQQSLIVPLPEENGYSWLWITEGIADSTPLKPNAANEKPTYGYSPQSIIEGWINLEPNT